MSILSRERNAEFGVFGGCLRISVTDMAALKVRIRGRHRPPPPDLFYQKLPPEGIALLATTPEFAVSMPGNNSWFGVWPFTASPPEFTTGIVVVYQLQPDCRYVAVAVRDGGNEYTLEEFIKIARRRARDIFGNIEKIPGRYIYAAPEKEEWGNILRDDGYVALNPDTFTMFQSAHVSPHCEATRYGHFVRIRAPFYSGDKIPERTPLPVFSRVEVLREDDTESRWLNFEEYQRERAALAVIPDAIADCFGEWLLRLTKESGFDKWRFRPGMAFGDRTEWWGPRGRRRTVHEGLDFVEGFSGGEARLVPEGVPARAIASGEVVVTLDDYMGKTVVVRHPSLTQPDGNVFHTLVSHIQTEGTMPPFVNKGEILGRIGKRAGIRIRPHLHLTGAWFPADFPFAEAGINTIMHPGFTPAILANLNNLVETSPLCVISPDDREFLIDD